MKRVELKPTAKVSVSKSVLKKYKVDNQDVYFLKDGTEFEIELFNPLQETVLCNIIFNGKKSNNEGLVLEPGQRIFLERYLDTNDKFLFNTYEVEDNDEVRFAIAENGLVRVTFHKESFNYSYNVNGWVTPNIIDMDNWTSPNIFYCNTTGTSIDSFATITNSVMTTASGNLSTNTVTLDGIIETGRISKGNESDQAFTYVNKDFNIYSFSHVEFKLLPNTYKPKTSKDLKVRTYCTQCGKKAKVKSKFCSACGNKL